jgi:hypothetical protein
MIEAVLLPHTTQQGQSAATHSLPRTYKAQFIRPFKEYDTEKLYQKTELGIRNRHGERGTVKMHSCMALLSKSGPTLQGFGAWGSVAVKALCY